MQTESGTVSMIAGQESVVTVAIDDVAADPERFVALVEAGTSIIIARDGRPVVAMRPMDGNERGR